MGNFESIVQRLATNKLWSFPGGVHPEGKKSISNTTPIARVSLPERFYIPLKQHIGTEGTLLVEAGQKVLKGQALTKSAQTFSVPVHAPTSGIVTALEEHVSPHPSGLTEYTIVIEPDGLEEWTVCRPQPNYQTLEKLTLIEMICDAGISGLGGAGFPTHIKTNSQKPTDFLIINGIECEPYITADDRLMREHAWQIRQGIDILQYIVEPKHIVIAIEDNKPEAIEALEIAFKNKPDCSVVSVPTIYPAGGEKQLIQVLTGLEVPNNGLPADIGMMMVNVGTCFAVADAIIQGKPLIERVVTLTGEAAKAPQNVWALIGTPVEHLAKFAQWNVLKRHKPRIIMGGPMMGFTVSSPLVPVIKTTNCLLMPLSDTLSQGNNEMPCIRCSACSDVCPASLLPQQLYWHTKGKEYQKAQDYNLFDCIECGACAYVCPSDIPLVQYYRQAKSAIRHELDEKNKAEKAKQRFETRKQRLDDEKRVREEKHQKAVEARKAAKAAQEKNSSDLHNSVSSDSTTSSTNTKAPKSAAVAAAIARAKAKKQQQNNAASSVKDDVSTSEQAPVVDTDDKKAKVAAAVARAKAKAKEKAEKGQLNNKEQD